MRITSLQFHGYGVTPKTNWCFLEVRTDNGLTGIGECTLAGHEALLQAEVVRLARRVTGQNAGARNRLCRVLPHAPGGLVAHTVLSAFEQALWDLAGQDAGAPIHALLGGGLRDSVPLYANINRGADPRTPEGFAAAAKRAVGQGFRAVKLAPFDGVVWQDAADQAQRAHRDEGVVRVAAVREAVGKSIDVLVDCHWRFSEAEAARLIRDLAPLDLFWIECPVTEANLPAIRRLRGLANDRGIRLAGAESLSGLAAYRPLIETGAYDVLMPDIKHAGGHEEIRRIAALADTAGVMIAPHNPTGPVCHAHSVHLCATLPNLLPLEVQFGETPLFFQSVTGVDLAFLDGMADVPDRPGLGLSLDADRVRENPVRVHDRSWLDPRLG